MGEVVDARLIEYGGRNLFTLTNQEGRGKIVPQGGHGLSGGFMDFRKYKKDLASVLQL